MAEAVTITGLTPRKDPYRDNFAQAAESIAGFEEYFAKFLDAQMSWNSPEVLTEADAQYFQRLYQVFGLNFYSINYYTVTAEAEQIFPFLEAARAWSKVSDTGRTDLPSHLRFLAQVFLRPEDKRNRFLIIHELAHILSDVVAEGIGVTNIEVVQDHLNLNPLLYPRSPFEISLWNNLVREGMAILFESTDTIEMNEEHITEAENQGYLDMTVLEFLTTVHIKDKRQPFDSPAVLITKNIAAGLTAEQIARFGQQRQQPTSADQSYWHLPIILAAQQEEQVAMFAQMMQLSVRSFLDKYRRDFIARQMIVVEPLLAWVKMVRKEA